MKHLFSKRSQEDGQGLVEYALLLVLVAVVVVGILSMLGSTVHGVFTEVVAALSMSKVAITRAHYDSGDEELHLDTTYDGDYDPTVTMTASPGGVMEARSNHYHLKYTLTGCPCTVTVTSSKGGSATVEVGP